MGNYFERLKLEQQELECKINKLKRFIGSVEYISLKLKHQELLVQQFNAMNEYNRILKKRIELVEN